MLNSMNRRWSLLVDAEHVAHQMAPEEYEKVSN